MNLTIWTLNRAAELLYGEEERIRGVFPGDAFNLTFGTREVPAEESERQLMPDLEYFVPIPLKCIGRKYTAGDLDPEAKVLLDEIAAQYHYFSSKAAFEQWWSPTRKLRTTAVERRFGQQRMTTPDFKGYYDLLEEYENNVLIGYSQGGLVARYLAFLDRHVFKQNKVAAVLTIASPNYGSPLANPDNRDAVAAGLLQFLVAMLSFHRNRFPEFYAEIGRHVTFDALYHMISTAQVESGGADPHGARELLETMVKWFSGLLGDANSAFYELDIRRYFDDRSVLALVNGHHYAPSGVCTGSVVTANHNLDEILRSVLIGERSRTLKDIIVRTLKDWGLVLVRRLRIFGVRIEHNIGAAGEVYARLIMKERLGRETTPLMKELVRSYREGVADVPKIRGKAKQIPEYAHDFIIPSVYQLLPDDDRLLGQYLRLDASHNSGKDQTFRAGRQIVENIFDLLKRLRDALHSA